MKLSLDELDVLNTPYKQLRGNVYLEFKRQVIDVILKHTKGNVWLAAQLLKTDRANFDRMIRRCYGEAKGAKLDQYRALNPKQNKRLNPNLRCPKLKVQKQNDE